ncbi:MAG: hypothetical protein D6766_12835 [Verrucomicrobia bacterium]|nr:MAG: hypothetical protein D6766_12835 [Verrucomicrobiota bacterium]
MKAPTWLQSGGTRQLLVLAIEDSHVALAELRRRNGHGADIRHSLSLPLPASRIEQEPEEAGRLLAEALQTHGFTSRRCLVRTPLSWVLAAPIEVPGQLPAGELPGFLELQAEQQLALPPGRARIAGDFAALPEGRRRGLLAALPQNRFDALLRFLQAAGLKPVSVTADANAPVTADEPLDEGVLRIAPAGKGLDLVLTLGPHRLAFRHLDPPNAGAGHLPIEPADLVREIRLTLGRWPAEWRSLCRRIAFHGAESFIDELHAAAKPLLEAAGWKRVDREPHRPVATGNGPLPHACEALLGAAHGVLRGQPLPLEFLPRQETAWERIQRRFAGGHRRQLILAGVGLVLLLWLPAWWQAHRLGTLEQTWKEMAGPVAKLEQLQTDIRSFRPWFARDPESLLVLEAVTEAFPEEGEVWARSIEWKADGQFTCNGLARSQQAIMATLERLRADPHIRDLKLKQVRGQNPVQFAFQFTWRHDAQR